MRSLLLFFGMVTFGICSDTPYYDDKYNSECSLIYSKFIFDSLGKYEHYSYNGATGKYYTGWQVYMTIIEWEDGFGKQTYVYKQPSALLLLDSNDIKYVHKNDTLIAYRYCSSPGELLVNFGYDSLRVLPLKPLQTPVKKKLIADSTVKYVDLLGRSIHTRTDILPKYQRWYRTSK